MTHIACGYFFGSGIQNDVSICALITWFLSKDRKRIRLLSAFLVGSTWPMSFPVALLVSLF
ncbi:MAG: GhoT/OrtT family toxin [Enterobacter sp.]|nr:GhoT/OrtT family toxin [Enterobacter sp.]